MSHAHFTPADKPLADTFAAVLEDVTVHPVIHDLHDPDVARSREDRYELAALLAVVARIHAERTPAGTNPLPAT